MGTYTAKPGEVEKKWILIDANGLAVGRLAVVIANYLRGKHKAQFTPHVDCGDNVVVVNAEKVQFTGKKRNDKIYYRHTGYPGGIKERRARHVLDGKQPERVLEMAVRRMLPGGALGRNQFKKLHVYAGPDHPHQAQRPSSLDVAAMNTKNTVRDRKHG